MLPIQCRIIDGTGASSTAQLENRCVRETAAQIVVILRDKVRVSTTTIRETIDLVRTGFGLVSRWGFGFFAIRRDVYEYVGDFDERFIGGCEDSDYFLRMCELDIAIRASRDIAYTFLGGSLWADREQIGKDFLAKKWSISEQHKYAARSIEVAEFERGSKKRPEGILGWNDSSFQLENELAFWGGLRVIGGAHAR